MLSPCRLRLGVFPVRELHVMLEPSSKEPRDAVGQKTTATCGETPGHV